MDSKKLLAEAAKSRAAIRALHREAVFVLTGRRFVGLTGKMINERKAEVDKRIKRKD